MEFRATILSSVVLCDSTSVCCDDKGRREKPLLRRQLEIRGATDAVLSGSTFAEVERDPFWTAEKITPSRRSRTKYDYVQWTE